VPRAILPDRAIKDQIYNWGANHAQKSLLGELGYLTFDDEQEPVATGPLRIVWNHRWEWDKGPDQLFNALYNLKDAGLDFRLSVLGT
jgi:glycosyltransferase involved in cell wall biosynthesis